MHRTHADRNCELRPIRSVTWLLRLTVRQVAPLAQAAPFDIPAATASVSASSTAASAPHDDVALAGTRACSLPYQLSCCMWGKQGRLLWLSTDLRQHDTNAHPRSPHVLARSRQGAGHSLWRDKRGQVNPILNNLEYLVSCLVTTTSRPRLYPPHVHAPEHLGRLGLLPPTRGARLSPALHVC